MPELQTLLASLLQGSQAPTPPTSGLGVPVSLSGLPLEEQGMSLSRSGPLSGSGQPGGGGSVGPGLDILQLLQLLASQSNQPGPSTATSLLSASGARGGGMLAELGTPSGSPSLGDSEFGAGSSLSPGARLPSQAGLGGGLGAAGILSLLKEAVGLGKVLSSFGRTEINPSARTGDEAAFQAQRLSERGTGQPSSPTEPLPEIPPTQLQVPNGPGTLFEQPSQTPTLDVLKATAGPSPFGVNAQLNSGLPLSLPPTQLQTPTGPGTLFEQPSQTPGLDVLQASLGPNPLGASTKLNLEGPLAPPLPAFTGFERAGGIEPAIGLGGGPTGLEGPASSGSFFSPASLASMTIPTLISSLFPKSPAAQAAGLAAGPVAAGLTGGLASGLGAGFLAIPSLARLIFGLTRKPTRPGDPDPYFGLRPAFESLGLALPTIPPPPPRPAWSPPPAPNLAGGTGENIGLLRELAGFKYPPFSTTAGSPPVPGLSPLAQKVISKNAELALAREQAENAAFARRPVEGG